MAVPSWSLQSSEKDRHLKKKKKERKEKERKQLNKKFKSWKKCKSWNVLRGVDCGGGYVKLHMWSNWIGYTNPHTHEYKQNRKSE